MAIRAMILCFHLYQHMTRYFLNWNWIKVFWIRVDICLKYSIFMYIFSTVTKKCIILRLYPYFHDELCTVSCTIWWEIHQAFIWYENLFWKFMQYSDKSNFFDPNKHKFAQETTPCEISYKVRTSTVCRPTIASVDLLVAQSDAHCISWW